ncbi:Phosphopantothenoylcysteine decarboxylase [Alkalibacterium sp. AK22]|uniref:bifunctional phosphopantothenoylcysteine decarboxylase/phosphopantothenate--cysteine ligase CoaBC n=1 Tax=Alkalibacterium sp. AK22 TaxID=1229520 RepID=UPI00044CFC53|nr:bifunctional phosphopantothenoylcysteine decarboxylase/phosphopantothenate--cysteine ligase CoaBC [Alkalibacterium sp. AK22]EXJ24231.1 Phosphopantothenoylcysteine decarboxylase [Alkalibacterium sp. AK22]
MIKGKKIAFYVTGGIAVYKAVDLMRELIKRGAEVRVAMTPSAGQFVTPLTFQVLSRRSVSVDTFSEEDPSVVNHINIADWADYAVIAPLSANTLAKLANGLADNFVTSALLATAKPIFAVPAMNANMYRNPITQENIRKLAERRVTLMKPDIGFLAEGYSGEGRYPEKERIISELELFIRSNQTELPLEGEKVIVTAGGTRERIDPVRYITNDSSGKMGHALAVEAWKQGAEVILVTASPLAVPSYIHTIRVESAQQMHEAVLEEFNDAAAVIMAAAVSDYTPETRETQKMKKKEDLTLRFKKNPDILKDLGTKKTAEQCLIGFAAETEELVSYAKQKLRDKHADLIVANDVSQSDRGFNSDQNEVTLLTKTDNPRTLTLRDKSEIAGEIISWLINYID